MQKRIDRHEWLAGLLLLSAFAMLITAAMRMQISMVRVTLIGFAIWSILHLLWPHRAKVKLGFMMTSFLFLPAVFVYLPSDARDSLGLLYPGAFSWGEQAAILLKLDTAPAFGSWFIDAFIGGAEGAYMAFESIFIFAVAVLVASTLYSLVYKRRHFGWLLVPVALFMQQWYNYTDGISLYFSIYFIGFLALAGAQTQHSRAQVDEADQVVLMNYRRKGLQRYMLVFGLVFVIAGNLLLNFVPIGSINRSIAELVPTIVGVRTGYVKPSMQLFSFGGTMYQPNAGTLGGPVEPASELLVLKVFSDKPNQYLRGRVSARYNGENWYNEHTEYTNMIPYTERLDEAWDPDKRAEVTVLPQNIRTMTLFTPLGVAEVDLNKEQVFANADDAMYFKRKSFEGPLLSYTVRSVGTTYLLEDKDDYLQLPGNYDRNVRDLAYQITSGVQDDREKMERLTAYLRENYTYDLNVAEVEPGTDFVHHFLFEEQKGYCTYFATSLAVMGRVVDVPTRYVTGYLLPPSKSRDGSYDVYGDRAHAWVEAYIEGEGWQIFEATPAYPAQSAGTGASEAESQQALEEVEESSGSRNVDIEGPSPDDLARKEAMMDLEFNDIAFTPLNTEPQRDYTGIILVGLYGLLAAAGVSGLFVMAMTRKYFDMGDHRRQAIRYIYYIDDLVDGAEWLSPAEKLQAYVSDDQASQSGFPENDINDIMNFMNDLLYGHGKLAEDMLEKLKRVAKRIERQEGQLLGKYSYWLKKR